MSPKPPSINAKRRSGSSGFTLIEVMISLTVLAIGLLGVAALVSSTVTRGNQARYMSMANLLASEKLDSLNKWPSSSSGGVVSSDPNISPGGSLTGPTTCASGDDYCDQVTVSETTGANYETQTQMVNGTAVTTTIVQTASGCVDTPANCGIATPTAGGTTFVRRWLITSNPTITAVTGGTTATVTGARRITVVVNLINQGTEFPVSFQMSMVRP